jgi:trans-aconitate 2-methyltransferase
MRETAADPRWASAMGDVSAARAHILASDAYYDLLSPEAASVDVWRTTYHHPMNGPADIVQWFQGTGLRPFVDALTVESRAELLAEYERRIALAYGPRADGRRLLAFPRLFIVARRRS